jgi:primosomal protein N' (replication factor Y)
LGYPPFSQLVRLEYRHCEPLEAEKATQALALRIKEWIAAEKRSETSLIGPAPCFFARDNGLYRWQIILRGADPVSLLRGRVPDGWRVEVQPVSLL